jgi:outer membrane protein OmpA-like peptidoglycan-associated protein
MGKGGLARACDTTGWEWLNHSHPRPRLAAAWLVAMACLWMASCSHRLVVETTPSDAQIHAVDAKGRPTKLLGRSPLVLEDVDAPSLHGLLIDKPGYVPRRVDVPFASASDVRLDLDLQQLDRAFINALPPDSLRAVIDAKMGDLVAFQQTLFATTPEEAEREITAQETRLGGTAAFHYIVGSWNFYVGRYDDAARSFTRSLALAPDFEQARRMLVLTDVKSVSRTQVARTRAFGALQAAAAEVASVGNGFLVRTKSNENLSEPDGFEVILPTDGLFRPTTAKLRKEGLPLLTQLAVEMKKLDQTFEVTVEAHTDSDFSSEMRNVPGAVVTGKSPFKNAWELSSARATAVLELLRAEGVQASLWNIAGYGDSRPLQVRAGAGTKLVEGQKSASAEKAAATGAQAGIVSANLPADGSLTRRIVVRVSLLGRSAPVPSVSREESERLKARLKMFLDVEEPEGDAPRSKRGGRDASGRAGASSDDARSEQAPSRPSAGGVRGARGSPVPSPGSQSRGVNLTDSPSRDGSAPGTGGPSASDSPSLASPDGGPADARSIGTAPASAGGGGRSSGAAPASAGGRPGGAAPTPIRPGTAPVRRFGSAPSGTSPPAASGRSDAGTTSLSAKPLGAPPAPNARPLNAPPPVREVRPDAIPRPRVPALRPQTGRPGASQ